MKITVLQGAFLPVPPLYGGAVEKLWHSLSREFATRGHTVTHISKRCDELPERNQEYGVRHVRVRGYDQPANGVLLKLRDLQYSLRAVRSIPKDSDVIVTNSFWAPLLLRNRRGVYVSVERMPKGQMRLYRRAARLRANSVAVRDAIIKECPSLASQTKVVPNPLPFVPDREVSLAMKERKILYVGRLHPEKGIELLSESFSSALKRPAFSGWGLEVVGPADKARGGGGDRWISELRSRYNNPAIVWRGPIYQPGLLNQLYERAAIFVYPSLAEKGESFGLAPLEAMAWGTPPVVSALPCFRDFVVHEKNGLTFEHRGASAVANLASALEVATTLWPRLAQEALRVRQTHSTEKISEMFLIDFQMIADSRRAGAFSSH